MRNGSKVVETPGVGGPPAQSFPAPWDSGGLASSSIPTARGIPTFSFQSLVICCWGEKGKKKKWQNSI